MSHKTAKALRKQTPMAGGTALAASAEPLGLTEKDLTHWNLLKHFQTILDRHLSSSPLDQDRKRLLDARQYLSLFLFGLMNPAIQSMRGLCEATDLRRIQDDITGRTVSLGSFSEIQHLIDPTVLEKVMEDLGKSIQASGQTYRVGEEFSWLIQDGSLWRALPRMRWARHGVGHWAENGDPHNAVRLHLSFHLLDEKPVTAVVTEGKACERKVWKEKWQPGCGYVGDRNFGANFQLLEELSARGCGYILRLKGNITVNVLETLPVSEKDKEQGVVKQVWATLGHEDRGHRVRVVYIEAEGHSLILVTNQPPEAMEAELVSLLYRRRWKVELFFRWVKCILKCRHWFAESHRGATIQLYLALIAALLFQMFTGRKPSRRLMELLQFYFMGLADIEDLERGLLREKARAAKKSN